MRRKETLKDEADSTIILAFNVDICLLRHWFLDIFMTTRIPSAHWNLIILLTLLFPYFFLSRYPLNEISFYIFIHQQHQFIFFIRKLRSIIVTLEIQIRVELRWGIHGRRRSSSFLLFCSLHCSISFKAILVAEETVDNTKLRNRILFISNH